MITVIKPGMLTTIQDLGRYGFQRYGVLVNGAMDTFSHRLANLLVGNHEATPTLEATLIGPHLRFELDTMIAIGGADLSPAIDGHPIQIWKPYAIKRGQYLTFGAIQNGCRSYIAVAGGFQVPAVMQSASTYLRGKYGGVNGRPLQKDDQLLINVADREFNNMKWSIADELLPRFHSSPTIHVVRGQQFNLFTAESQHCFFTSTYEVTPQSDRMGCRLKGPLLKRYTETEMLSEAVAFGTIQVSSDGSPIVLLADRQTTGGYPKIAQIASADFPNAAQVKPGDRVNFKEISHEEAQEKLLKLERNIHYVKQGTLLK
ncbi:biotin-dependent carboxyltransferase family protein [Bacillus sp. AGMB 02131]|uniref:Biotin-dependent carboxyltransferase family protein n=1 Tax=Peribacillus faecalis TaxID=2772559 RepID=A0A927D027_9BACI|nr:biotin-dependent carboxyltransferase family protein [Peribacillus faecalis]MBD3109090.1 biotin-dependent carboxyltransferase family protein [Peribacillus faecalis]